MRSWTSTSVADTERIAAEVASDLTNGGVIALDGDLGAGKTQFVRGLVKALGGDGRQVSSPTYTLLQTYDLANGRRLHHLDAYRVASDDFEAIGFEELLDSAADVIAVEWPSRVADLLPPGTLWLRLAHDGEATRCISQKPPGSLPDR